MQDSVINVIISLEKDLNAIESMLASVEDSQKCSSYQTTIKEIRLSLSELKSKHIRSKKRIHSICDFPSSANLYYILNNDLSPKLLEIDIPHRVFTQEELCNHYDGQDGRPCYLTGEGLVFDVSDHPIWSKKIYASLQRGLDSTEYFAAYHHHNVQEMCKTGKLLGRLIT